MTGLGLVLFAAGWTLLYSGVKAVDPRCLLQRVFDSTKTCPRIDASEADPAATALSKVGPSGTLPSNAGGTGHIRPGGTFNDNDSVKNLAVATAVSAAVKIRFPSAKFAGICNCRKQRGTGSDPTQYSVHSVCGAVDFFTTDPNGMIAYAKTLPGVWDAWLDASPGDVHIQVVPNPPHGWIPPCAGGKPLP